LPELPEVETLRGDLAHVYVGRRLLRVVVTGRRTVRRHDPALLGQLEGLVLTSVGRLGKYLLLEWDDGQVLVAHLRMSGQMLSAQPGSAPLPHTHAVFVFSEVGELRFVDPRTFGELFVAERAGDNRVPGRAVKEIAHLGPDALELEERYLASALAGRRAPLKSLLVDQRVLAGIGNIYADEICFDARTRPDRPGGSLSRAQVRRLKTSVGAVLSAAIAGKGSSLRDQQYRDLYGQAGLYQAQHKVYGRSGEPCLRCGRAIERVMFGARSAYMCGACQH
jgi:formamidopyrimidine-DNA glycosylase